MPWPARVTLDPTHEKLASPPSIDGSHLIVVTGGYIGDIPPYQGHVVEISRATGQIQAVFNSLCSNVRHLMHPSTCPYSDSAIWGSRRGGRAAQRGHSRRHLERRVKSGHDLQRPHKLVRQCARAIAEAAEAAA